MGENLESEERTQVSASESGPTQRPAPALGGKTQTTEVTRERDFHCMELALAQARQAAAAGEVPVGAVVVDGEGGILAQAHNAPIALNDPTAHAEILALRQAAATVGNYRLPGATLYVTIEPCLMCVGAMIQARIHRLVFGAADPKAGACVSLYRVPEDQRLNHRLEVTGGVREAECRELLQNFFQARRG